MNWSISPFFTRPTLSAFLDGSVLTLIASARTIRQSLFSNRTLDLVALMFSNSSFDTDLKLVKGALLELVVSYNC